MGADGKIGTSSFCEDSTVVGAVFSTRAWIGTNTDVNVCGPHFEATAKSHIR